MSDPTEDQSDRTIDFGRSFVFFTTDRVHHTPRLQLAGRTHVAFRESETTYYVSVPCISESMYRPADLIQQPSQLVYVAVRPGAEVSLTKVPAPGSAASIATSVCALDSQMTTFSGEQTTFIDTGARVATWPRAEQLDGYDRIQRAVLDGAPMVGITTYSTDTFAVIAEFPVTTINVAHDQDAWQVDVGPLLLPSPDARSSGLRQMRLAYMVFNNAPGTDHFWPIDVAGADGRVEGVDAVNRLYAVSS